MNRFLIGICFFVWIFAAGRLIYGMREGNDITEAFGKVDFDRVSTQIYAFGEYGRMKLSEAEKMQIVKSFAKELGMNDEYDIDSQADGDTQILSLTKNTSLAKVEIKAITVKEEYLGALIEHQYVAVDFLLKKSVLEALSYKELIEKIYREQNIDGNVNVNLEGELNGPLNYARKDEIADRLIKALGAEVVAENRDNSLFTVYAYAQNIEEYIINDGKKVNINVSLRYDENRDVTIIYLSTPLNSLDY